MLASRAHDGRLRLWDVRRFKEPLLSAAGLYTSPAGAGCGFDKDGLLVATVTCSAKVAKKKRGGSGKVLFFDIQRDNPAPVHMLDLGGDESGVAFNWHHTLNQIVVGTQSGHARMLFAPKYSIKGALQVAGKKPKMRNNGDGGILETSEMAGGVVAGIIMNPNALPLFQDQASAKSQRLLDRRDPEKSKRPFMPHREAQHMRYMVKSTNFTKQIVKERKAEKYLDANARKELLKYEERTKNNQEFTSAWVKTQPKTILMARTAEQEAIDVRKADEEYLKNH